MSGVRDGWCLFVPFNSVFIPSAENLCGSGIKYLWVFRVLGITNEGGVRPTEKNTRGTSEWVSQVNLIRTPSGNDEEAFVSICRASNARCSPRVGLMPGRCLRHRPGIKPTRDHYNIYLVFAGCASFCRSISSVHTRALLLNSYNLFSNSEVLRDGSCGSTEESPQLGYT